MSPPYQTVPASGRSPDRSSSIPRSDLRKKKCDTHNPHTPGTHPPYLPSRETFPSETPPPSASTTTPPTDAKTHSGSSSLPYPREKCCWTNPPGSPFHKCMTRKKIQLNLFVPPLIQK